MIKLKAEKGVVDISHIIGTENEIMEDIAAICTKVVFLVANNEKKTKKQVMKRYEVFMKQLVNHIERNLETADTIGD